MARELKDETVLMKMALMEQKGLKPTEMGSFNWRCYKVTIEPREGYHWVSDKKRTNGGYWRKKAER